MPDNMGYEEAAIQKILGSMDSMADAVAGEMGMPPGGQRYSQQDLLDQWNYSPIASPQVRVETMLQMKDAGKSHEEITDAIYPNRRRLITTSRPQVGEQIRFAQQMEKLMRKQAERMQAPPEMPMPAAMTAAPQEPVAALPVPPMTTPEPAPAAPLAPASAGAAPSILDTPFSMMSTKAG